ncbi:hypothetical protein SAMN05216464_101871 [Mucilaginibacter pineti]|uniref:DUF308 domain-containing protein n=1 Tax=Mucilaginibacter pineti TaxID=1391627 RepID=A0A1G6V5K3_9SPHI|nr:hypothetical protein [Mucilaginibacter pineti]SDD48909.1 hypothetical protein SAMN05216464_101871 [Mucilaginibacter pineti]
MKTPDNNIAATAKAMRSLYFTRVTFSVIWVTLVAIFAKSSPQIAAVLLVIYPAWDVLGTIWDIRINRGSGSSLTPQYTNAVISVATTVAVGVALSHNVPAAIIVFGVWAGLTGIIQLVLGLQRRKTFGGQWPMILSGGQSLIAGISFIILAHDPTKGIASLAGYSAFGAFYYLLAAIRLNKTAAIVNTQLT